MIIERWVPTQLRGGLFSEKVVVGEAMMNRSDKESLGRVIRDYYWAVVSFWGCGVALSLSNRPYP